MEKILYQREYEINEARRDAISSVSRKDLTLKDVLDIGFNLVIISDTLCEGYVDHNDHTYWIEGVLLNDHPILNEKVHYVGYEFEDEYDFESYLDVIVAFDDASNNQKLKDIIHNNVFLCEGGDYCGE